MAKKKPAPKAKSKPKPKPAPKPFVAKQSKVASKIYQQFPERFKNYQQARAAASHLLQNNNNSERGLSGKKLDYGVRGWTKTLPKPKAKPAPQPFIAKQSKIASKIYEQFPDRFKNYGEARKAATKLLHENGDKTRGLNEKVLDYGLRKIKREATIEAAQKKKPGKAAPGKPGKKKKKGSVLTEINKRASELYREHPEWFEDYHEAQRAAADIIAGEYGDVEGVSETKFDDAVHRWHDKNVPEEEEEELPPPPVMVPPDLPDPFLTVIDYFELDERFTEIQKHVLDQVRKDSQDPLKELYVTSPLLSEDFDAIDYNYNNTFKPYVDWMNEKEFRSGEFQVKFTLLPNLATEKWYILVEEDLDQNNGPSGYTPEGGVPSSMRPVSPMEHELGRRAPRVATDDNLTTLEKYEKLQNLIEQREFLRSTKTEKQEDRQKQLNIIASLRDSKDPQEQELVATLRRSNVELSKEIDELSRQEAGLTRKIGVK